MKSRPLDTPAPRPASLLRRRRSINRIILATAIAPAALTFSATGADVTINGNSTINVTPVYGEGLREGFVGLLGNAHNDDETTPNPNRIGGGLPPPEDIGPGFTDPVPPYNITLDVRMGQNNQGDPPDTDGYVDAAGKPYGWANSRTFIYTGQIQATTNFLSFAMNTDDTDWLRINGVVVLNDNTWNTPIQALSAGALGNPNLVAGLGLTVGQWYDIEFRMSDTGGGGAGPSGQGTGWVDVGDHSLDYGVGINTTGFKQNGANGNTTPLADSTDGGDYIKPVETADGTPQLFRYLINAGGGGDDLHVTGNAVVSITGTGNTVVENSVRIEPTTPGGTINLTINNSDADQRTLTANSTLLGNSDNAVTNLDGSATLRLNNLDDNGRTGVVLNKNGGTGEVIISGTAAADGLNGATLSVTDGRLTIQGDTDPLVGLTNAIQIKGPNGKLRIRTRTGAGVRAMASGTLEHVTPNNDGIGSVTIDPGQTLIAEISDGLLNIAGNLAGNILRKLGVGTLITNGETNLSAVNVEGGRLELNGKTILATAPTLTSGTLALLNSGTGAAANQIPGPLTIPAGTILEGTPNSFVDATAAPNVLNLTGGTLRLFGTSTGLNLNIYDSDPRAGTGTDAYSGVLDTFRGIAVALRSAQSGD